jgi:pimeloyl-ACP methyl ester carboxylesterase
VIVLVHSGICDARMWDGFDLPGATPHEMRGFGNTPLPPTGEYSHADDLEATLTGEQVTLVGASFGGLVCLELAARRQDLVTDLVVMDAPLPDHNWSEEMLSGWQHEDALLEQGEWRAAAEWNADFWLSEAAGPGVRARVIEMQEHAFKLQSESEAEEAEHEPIELGGVRARTLVAVGELDKPDMHAIAERLVRDINGAQAARIEGAGHLPALERPNVTARLVRDFLGRI